jgi:hypothetical protein
MERILGVWDEIADARECMRTASDGTGDGPIARPSPLFPLTERVARYRPLPGAINLSNSSLRARYSV